MSVISTCVLRYKWNEGCHLMIWGGALLKVVENMIYLNISLGSSTGSI